ncbi:MAG: cobalamin-dependent protein [Bradymonadales bacterium]|nr:cobalamin-dependent protein [Bradymonadales bacterium]
MKVVLIHPPQATFFSPYLAIPALAAALEQAGHQVVALDLNLQTNLLFLSAAYLDSLPGGAAKELSKEVEAAVAALREPDTYRSEERIQQCYALLDRAYAALSASVAPTRISHDLQMRYHPFSLTDLEAAIGDRRENPYIELFTQSAIPQLTQQQPDLVGIGVAFDSQLIPALTLASLLRQRLVGVPIVVGGNIITKIHRKLLERQTLLPGIDLAVVHEGETPLCALADAIERDRRQLEGVPNLLWRQGDRVVLNQPTHTEDLSLLPAPSFDGLPLDRYLLPIRLLPTLTSRGCYWSRCAFCTHSHGYGHFRLRPEERLVADLDRLRERYQTDSFFLADEAVPPRQVEALARYVDARGAPLQWFGDVRFEKALTRPEFVDKLVRSGCRLLAFGLESASARVLSLMDKGGSPELFEEVLRSCHQAGIFNVAMFFSGFPGETLPEAHATFQFIQKHRELIDGWGNGAFTLQGGSLVHAHPERFTITSMKERAGAELSEVYDYTVGRGLSMSAAAQISESIGKARLRDPKYARLLPREITFTRLVLGGPLAPGG